MATEFIDGEVQPAGHCAAAPLEAQKAKTRVPATARPRATGACAATYSPAGEAAERAARSETPIWWTRRSSSPWLAGLMAVQAGLPSPRMEFAGRGSKKRREEYLAAVKQGYLEDYLPLARFFEAAILRREAGR